MPTPHDYYDIHGMPRLHNVGEGRPYLENDYHANDHGPQVPSLSTIGRGPRGEGLKVGNVVNENGTVSFALYSDLTGELVWQSPNLDPGTLDFYPTDFRDMVAGQPAPMDIVHTRGGVTKTTTAYLPCGKRGSLVYLLGPDRIARNSDDTYQTTVGDLVIYNHYSWPNNHKPIPRVNDIVFFSYRNDEGTLENTKVIPLPPDKNPSKAVREYRGSTYAVNWDMVDEITDNTLGLIGFGFGTIEAVGTHNNEEVTPDTPVVFTARVFVPCYSELAEQDRIYNEWQRENAEETRQDAEQARQDAEAIRVENENTRIENEETRIELYEEVLELVKEGLVNPLIVEAQWDYFLEADEGGAVMQSVGDTKVLSPNRSFALYCRETAKTMYEAFSAGRKVLIHVEEEDEQGSEIIEQSIKAAPVKMPVITPSGGEYYEVIDAFTIPKNETRLVKTTIEEDEVPSSDLDYCFTASLPSVNKPTPPGSHPFCLTTSFATDADGGPVFLPNRDDDGVLYVNTYYAPVGVDEEIVLNCDEEAGTIYEAFNYGRTVLLGVPQLTKAAEDTSCWRILSAEYFYETEGDNPKFRFTAAYLHDNGTNKLITSEYVSSMQQPYFRQPADDSSSSDGLVVHMSPENTMVSRLSVVKNAQISCADSAYILSTFDAINPVGLSPRLYLSLPMLFETSFNEAFIGTPEEAEAATDHVLLSEYREFRFPLDELELPEQNDQDLVFNISFKDGDENIWRWYLYNVTISSSDMSITFDSDDPEQNGPEMSIQDSNTKNDVNPVRAGGGNFSILAFKSDKTAQEVWNAYSNGGHVVFQWGEVEELGLTDAISSISNAKVAASGGGDSRGGAVDVPDYVFQVDFPLTGPRVTTEDQISSGPLAVSYNGGTIMYIDYVDASHPDDCIYFKVPDSSSGGIS